MVDMPIMKRSSPARLVLARPIGTLSRDPDNPRKSDPARMGLLRLSLKKLGFIQPVFITPTGMLLSGHQRTTVAQELGFKTVPAIAVDMAEKDIRGANVLFNRATNDFTAFDTGSKASGMLDIDTVLAEAEALADFEGEHWFAIDCKNESLSAIASGQAERYDKKATNLALSVLKMGIRIPIVVSESGQIVNGIHRLFAALEANEKSWPIIRIPEQHAKVALNFLNYLSMDFHVDGDFEKLLRFSAYRRPQNNRGAVPKAMRFWGNGERTLPDKDSYSTDYWRQFRDIHGITQLDFGSGLSKAAPYLRTKGIDAYDFEPFRIDPDAASGVPSPSYSRQQARRFLAAVADPKLKFDSIFLCSVLNSVPFVTDRMCVLAIVHALSSRATTVYGTCRDISDYNYEYGGIRNANYFTFDSEPGVRIGDVMRNPKLQKFHTQDEAKAMFSHFWKSVEFWPGGNVFYFRLKAPIGFNPTVVAKALELEFDLPFSDGSTMGLVAEAKAAFSRRLMTEIP
jgi:ParB-like nuclease domain